jgi:hypothetical protein
MIAKSEFDMGFAHACAGTTTDRLASAARVNEALLVMVAFFHIHADKQIELPISLRWRNRESAADILYINS